jgi:hypothetical protein
MDDNEQDSIIFEDSQFILVKGIDEKLLFLSRVFHN